MKYLILNEIKLSIVKTRRMARRRIARRFGFVASGFYPMIVRQIITYGAVAWAN